MRSWRGLVMGAMALALLDAVVQTTGAANRVSGWGQGAAKLVSKFLDPRVPTFASTGTAPSAQTQALTTPAAAPATTAPATTAPATAAPPTTSTLV